MSNKMIKQMNFLVFIWMLEKKMLTAYIFSAIKNYC